MAGERPPSSSGVGNKAEDPLLAASRRHAAAHTSVIKEKPKASGRKGVRRFLFGSKKAAAGKSPTIPEAPKSHPTSAKEWKEYRKQPSWKKQHAEDVFGHETEAEKVAAEEKIAAGKREKSRKAVEAADAQLQSKMTALYGGELMSAETQERAGLAHKASKEKKGTPAKEKTLSEEEKPPVEYSWEDVPALKTSGEKRPYALSANDNSPEASDLPKPEIYKKIKVPKGTRTRSAADNPDKGSSLEAVIDPQNIQRQHQREKPQEHIATSPDRLPVATQEAPEPSADDQAEPVEPRIKTPQARFADARKNAADASFEVREGTPHAQLIEMRHAFARAHTNRDAQNTWSKKFKSSITFGRWGRAARQEAESSLTSAYEKWSEALEVYAWSEDKKIEEARAAAEKKWPAATLPTVPGTLLPGAGTPSKLEAFMQAYRGREAFARARAEQAALNQLRIEMLPPHEKSTVRKLVDVYRRIPMPAKIMAGAMVATGAVVATGGIPIAAAGAYGAWRVTRAVAGVVAGGAAAKGIQKAMRYVLKVDEKEVRRKSQARSTFAAGARQLRRTVSGERIKATDALKWQSAVETSNENERAKEKLKIFVAAVTGGVVVGGATALGTGLFEGNVRTAVGGPTTQPSTPAPTTQPSAPASTQPTAPQATQPTQPGTPSATPATPEPQAPAAAAQPTTPPPPAAANPVPPPAPVPLAPSPEPVQPPPPEPAPASAPRPFADRVPASPRGIWGMAEGEFMKDPRFASMNQAQRDYFLDAYSKDFVNRAKTLTPGELRAMGLRAPEGKGMAFKGDMIDMNKLNDPERIERFYKEATGLSRAQQENILRIRGFNTIQIDRELGVRTTAAPSSTLTASIPPQPIMPAAPIAPEGMRTTAAVTSPSETFRENIYKASAESSQAELDGVLDINRRAQVDTLRPILDQTLTTEIADPREVRVLSAAQIQERATDIYKEETRGLFDVDGGWFGSAEDGMLRFEKFAWQNTAQFLLDAKRNPIATAGALGISAPEVTRLYNYLIENMQEYGIDAGGARIGENPKTLKEIINEIARQKASR